jgi:hypothetical protein
MIATGCADFQLYQIHNSRASDTITGNHKVVPGLNQVLRHERAFIA